MPTRSLIHVSLPQTIVYTIIVLGNLVTIGSPANLLLTLPEIAFVFFQVFRNRVDLAVFYNLVFVITSISATAIMGMSDDPVSMYNYARLKLAGPVGVSYVISIILLFLSYIKHKRIPSNLLFSKLLRGFVMLATCGFIIGIIGLVFGSHYSISGMLEYGIYIMVVIINMYSLLLNYSPSFVKLVYESVIPLLSASVIASFILYYVLGVSTSYGGLDDVVLKADLTYFASMLVLALLFVKNKVAVVIPFLLFLVMSFNSSGGKEIILLGLAILFYLLALLHTSSRVGKKIIAISLLAVVVVYGFLNTASDSLFSMKMGAVTSLFSSDVSEVSESPYIRIGEIMNVFYGYFQHPYLLPFGSGYGGYFEDHLNMFVGINLEIGSYSRADVSSGFFHNAHDTFSVVPFLNGLFGLWIIFSYTLKYLKRIKKNYCAFAAIPWLLLTFYFNTQMAMTGVFLLFASEFCAEPDEYL